MEDYSIQSVDPYLIKEKIKSAIRKDGYFVDRWCRYLSIWIYIPENTWSIELQDEFREVGVRVNLERGTRFNMILGDSGSWAFNSNKQANLLILSENKENMEQDPKYCLLHEALENKGFFVAVAEPETLINQENAFEEPMSYGSETTCICQKLPS